MDIMMLMIGGGAIGAVLVVAALMSGPSVAKATSRRLEGVR